MIMMNSKIILTTAYLAPIHYYSVLLQHGQVLIEANENFIKQSYRNRCEIYGANGVLSLSIPVKKEAPKTKAKDILIDYDTNWRKLHWKSIESAYRSSPFFEFYADDIKPFYQREYKYLFDFNTDIQSVLLDHLEIDIKIEFTKEYIHDYSNSATDFRAKFHPKKSNTDTDFSPKEYFQVFQDKHGFFPNLSIIDLLFNEGPNTINILKGI